LKGTGEEAKAIADIGAAKAPPDNWMGLEASEDNVESAT